MGTYIAFGILFTIVAAMSFGIHELKEIDKGRNIKNQDKLS